MAEGGKPGGKRSSWAATASFLTSAADASALPEPDRPEVAFAGRSNVGKSSLLNALTGQQRLAKTSNTPGRTRLLNYFHLTDKGGLDCYLVDMPGYGFARAPKGEIKQWTRLVRGYMKGRVTLRRLFLLIDIRRGVGAADKDILELLQEAAVSTQVVVTKADKLKASERDKAMAKIKTALKPFVVVHPEVLLTSSLKKTGIGELREAVLKASES